MKKAIITGAAGNLGKATVKKFMEAGYYVIATVSSGNTVGIYDGNKNLEVHAVNATHEMQVNDFMQSMIGKHQQIDAALMLIGGFASGTIENTDAAGLQKMFTLNFNTAFLFARPAFNQMMKQARGGRLIFVGSVPAINDHAGFDMLAYALSKNAVVKLAKILNSEGQKKNVRTAVIVPTTIDTPQNRASMPDADFSKWTQPEEIAEVMEFICSQKGEKMKDLVIKM